MHVKHRPHSAFQPYKTPPFVPPMALYKCVHNLKGWTDVGHVNMYRNGYLFVAQQIITLQCDHVIWLKRCRRPLYYEKLPAYRGLSPIGSDAIVPLSLNFEMHTTKEVEYRGFYSYYSSRSIIRDGLAFIKARYNDNAKELCSICCIYNRPKSSSYYSRG